MSALDDLAVDVIALGRRLRHTLGCARLVDDGVVVSGLNETQQRQLAETISANYPQYATVRDGVSVKVTLR